LKSDARVDALAGRRHFSPHARGARARVTRLAHLELTGGIEFRALRVLEREPVPSPTVALEDAIVAVLAVFDEADRAARRHVEVLHFFRRAVLPRVRRDATGSSERQNRSDEDASHRL
jgi:hypothetical protein